MFLRSGTQRAWKNDDLQSFTPCRFMPPELMGYEGRAVVVDPDVFAVGDVCELFELDMHGKAIMAKPRGGHNGRTDYVATSVMLLDCAKLKHWNVRRNFAELFDFKRDYEDWLTLATEPEGTIGYLDSEWNDFDKLTPVTKLLHNTKRRTQPWKTGLPIDYTNRIPVPLISKIIGTDAIRLPLKYKRHPDPRQEQFFFALLAECLDRDLISTDQVEEEMRQHHIRPDSLDMVKSVPPLDHVLDFSAAAA